MSEKKKSLLDWSVLVKWAMSLNAARTRIRLALDLSVQSILLGLFLWQWFVLGRQSMSFFVGYVLCGAGWQFAHAYYLSKKYADWDRTRYLKYFKPILVTSVWLLLACLLFYSFAVPKVSTYVFTALQCLWGFGLGTLVLYGFGLSWKTWREHRARPKSFWDLE